MLSVVDVAQYFIERGEGYVTQLKLQKLVYYAQGFYLAKFGNPLFTEAIQAWDYGPVVLELRQEYGIYRDQPIPRNPSPEGLSIEQKIAKYAQYLEKIWKLFGHYTANQLVTMTHQEDPWVEAYRGRGSSEIISLETMRHYFSNRLNELEGYAETNNISSDSSEFSDMSELEEVISFIDTTEECFDSQFSAEFIEFSQTIAEKVKAQQNQNFSDDYVKELAKYLASHTD